MIQLQMMINYGQLLTAQTSQIHEEQVVTKT